MSTRIKFDIYESVLLLDAYIKYSENAATLSETLDILSSQLRNMARNRGQIIDEAFRSKKGLNYQIRCMEDAFTGRSSGREPTELFAHTVRLYKSSRNEYDSLLREAQSMSKDSGILIGQRIENETPSENQHSQIDEESLLLLVSQLFPNGIQPESIIDRKKLERAYEEKYSSHLPEEYDLKPVLTTSGVAVGKKVFVLSAAQKNAIKNIINSIFEGGNHVLFYNKILEIPLFEECHIFDDTTLKAVISSLIDDVTIGKDYLALSPDHNIETELLDAFGQTLKLSYSDIQKRKPYLDIDAVKWTLSYSNAFVWSESETYALVEQIRFADTDIQYLQSVFFPSVEKTGFASLRMLTLADSCALNPDVSYYAVRDALYIRYASHDYSRNGLIVTKHGETKPSYEILCDFCRTLDSASLEQINEYGHDLIGNQPITILSAAVYSMIRIDQRHFVSDEKITFDVKAIDNAVDQFVCGKVIPLSSITSFTAFPDVDGCSWNLYLLDCFLRRYSERFSIDGGPAQTNIVGAIAPKTLHFESYDDRLAFAVLQDSIPLSLETISDFLCSKKYILRRGPIIKRVLAAAIRLSEHRSGIDV